MQTPSIKVTSFSICFALLFTVVGLGAAKTSFGAQLAMSWVPSPDSRVVGYKLHYGTSSRRYTKEIDVQDRTDWTVSGLRPNQRYYFAATAYDAQGRQSVFSNEISAVTPDSEDDDVAGRKEDEQDPDRFDTDGDGYGDRREEDSGTDPEDSTSLPSADNALPRAEAGPTQTVDQGVLVVLDASQSIDPDGHISGMMWRQISGPAVDLIGKQGIRTRFKAPEVSGLGAALVFELRVIDDLGGSATDTCIVNVTWSNEPPVAEAAAPRNTVPGGQVILDGTRSQDRDGQIAAHAWQQVSGPEVSLSDLGLGRSGFTAPDTESVLRFELEVTDDQGLKDRKPVLVNVSEVNTAPVADAGPDMTVLEGETVSLYGFNSHDPDGGGVASYLWSQQSGPAVSLSDPQSAGSTLVAPQVPVQGAALEFSLTVCDEQGACAADQVLIHVQDNEVDFPNPLDDSALLLPLYAPEVDAGLSVSGSGALTSARIADPRELSKSGNRPSRLDWPFFDLEIRVASPGEDVQVEVFFDQPIPSGYTWVKYDPYQGWLDFSDQAAISSDRQSVILSLKDGGPGDDDGLANGVIMDPAGPALLEASSKDQAASSGGGGGGCVYSRKSGFSLEWALLLLVPVLFRCLASRRWSEDVLHQP